MGIIKRYVLFDVVRTFLVALMVLSLVVVIGIGLKEALSSGLPPLIALEAMFYMLPETLGVTIPISALLAVSSVYGRMAASNEIVALKSLGINPLAIVWPILAFSVALSLFTVVVYDIAAVWGRPSVKRVAAASIDAIAYSILQSKHCYRCPEFTILVEGVEGDRMIRPKIVIANKDQKQEITVDAAVAYLTVNQETSTVTIRLFDGQIDQGNKIRYSFSNDWWSYDIPLPKMERPVHRDWLSTSEIPVKIAEMQGRADGLQKTLAWGEPNINPAVLATEKADLKELIYQIDRLRTEPYRRWANGFTCLFFVLVGIPVAVYFRFESFLSGFFACFLPILCFYYPVLMFQEKLTTTGVLPPIFFWSGNMFLVGPGLWLMHKIRRF